MAVYLTDYRLKQRDYLLQIARAMNAQLDLPEVLSLVIRYAVEITRGRAGVIAMRPPGGELEVVASYRLESQYFRHLQPLLARVPATMPAGPRGQGWEGWQTAAMQAELKRLARRLPEFFDQIIALPLLNGEVVTGVLLVFRSAGAALFSPLDGQLLESFADQASVAIHNANLYATLSDQARELQLLLRFSAGMVQAGQAEAALALTVDHLTHVGPSSWAAVFHVDEGGDVILKHASDRTDGGPLPDRLLDQLAAESRSLLWRDEPLRLPDLRTQNGAPAGLAEMGMTAAVAVTIRGPSRPLGVLWVATDEAEPYDDETVRVLVTTAQLLGVTLDKFRLIDQLRARERELSTVVEHNPAGVLLLDAEGRVRLFNPVVQQLTGLPAAQFAGAHVWDVLKLEDEMGVPQLIPLPAAADTASARGYLRRHDGTRSRGGYMQISVTTLNGDGQQVAAVHGYVVNIVDLTALKQAESAKNIFLAGLSHELKTPLSLIRGYAETLQYAQARQDPTIYEESLNVILDETNHLTEMVDQMLLAARLQAGVVTLDLHELTLGPFVQKLVDSFRQTHMDRRWELEVAPDLPLIVADPGRLREVFYNMLSNAVKYSETGSAIRVTLAALPHGVAHPLGVAHPMGVRIEFHDEGIGIAPEDQARLFQRFFRASDRADGTGLGLYLSKAIVEAHGGTIRVESEPGRGSTFTVDLPLRPPEPRDGGTLVAG